MLPAANLWKGAQLSEQRWPALAPLTGVAFVILVVIGFIVGGESPDPDASPQKILSYYNDNDTQQIVASLLLGVGTVFFFFFLGVLRTVLRAVEGAVGRLSAVAFGGGLVLGVGMLAFAGFTFTLADSADHLTPDAAQALHVLNSDFFFPVSAGLATLLIATGIAGIRTRVLPAWISWIAIVLGIAALTPAGFFAFLAFGLWVLVVSVILWRAASAVPAAQP
jgi:vacuolar-type H+-ATPase subunit I/STV1